MSSAAAAGRRCYTVVPAAAPPIAAISRRDPRRGWRNGCTDLIGGAA